MQQYLTRSEVAIVIAALAILVVGVSLAVVPPTPAARTKVEAVITTSPRAEPTPTPSASPAGLVATGLPSPAPPPVAPPNPAPAPITLTGPDHLTPWRTGAYLITFHGSGVRNVAIWWSGAAMSNWTIELVQGHCEMTNSQDRFAGWVKDQTVVELDMTPSGWPGGQLVIQGSQEGGPPLGLAVVQVANHG